MPDLTFRIKWPDGTEDSCYSPSSVVTQFFSEGETYPLEGFLGICDKAFEAASERVRAVYGYPCSRAALQLHQLKTRAAPFRSLPHPTVTFVRFETGSASRTSQ